MHLIIFPEINPIAFTIGPIGPVGPIYIFWYSLSYVFGIILANIYANSLTKKFQLEMKLQHINEFVTWIIIAIIVGGRLGYVCFYDFEKYLRNPIEIVQIYKGGMSFHGGVIGCIIASILFSKRYSVPLLAITDIIVVVCPIGIFLGRIANFINGELYGRITSVEWGIIFPKVDQFPRHPSQIYEALAEGLVVFFIMFFAVFKMRSFSKQGLNSGLFLCCYAILRILIENYREPDFGIGFLIYDLTLGQLLCMPMLLLGALLIYKTFKINESKT